MITKRALSNNNHREHPRLVHRRHEHYPAGHGGHLRQLLGQAGELVWLLVPVQINPKSFRFRAIKTEIQAPYLALLVSARKLARILHLNGSDERYFLVHHFSTRAVTRG